MKQLPIKMVNTEKQKPFIEIVDKIWQLPNPEII